MAHFNNIKYDEVELLARNMCLRECPNTKPGLVCRLGCKANVRSLVMEAYLLDAIYVYLCFTNKIDCEYGWKP
jgi:hypothetical protein